MYGIYDKRVGYTDTLYWVQACPYKRACFQLYSYYACVYILRTDTDREVLLESVRWIWNYTVLCDVFKVHIKEYYALIHIIYIIIFPRNASFREYSPRHNFVVSAITFEGFKLRSSNLTHALLIQISRTSSIIDIVVPSILSKLKKKLAYRSEMAKNAIKSYFRTSKMATGGHFVKN